MFPFSFAASFSLDFPAGMLYHPRGCPPVAPAISTAPHWATRPDPSGAPTESVLLTKPLWSPGNRLVINTVAKGHLNAELLDLDGRTIQGFGRRHCDPFTGDHAAHPPHGEGPRGYRRSPAAARPLPHEGGQPPLPAGTRLLRPCCAELCCEKRLDFARRMD
jgi:hypothetical protein